VTVAGPVKVVTADTDAAQLFTGTSGGFAGVVAPLVLTDAVCAQPRVPASRVDEKPHVGRPSSSERATLARGCMISPEMGLPDGSSRLVGRYRMYGQIAAGGMATVHLGRFTGPDGRSRTVAIKCPHPHYAKDPEFAAMFLDEARLAARVNHPNVIAMLEVVMADKELFLVMEYVHGASLAQVLRALGSRGERLAAPVTASILGDMLRGLHAAHEAKGETGESLNIVHRDVSPQNVLVGIDGVGRLLDFGVAKAVGRLHSTRDGKIKGKLSYMAPEQITGKRVSRRADVYSASVVLWEALTGRRLFAEDGDLPPSMDGGAPAVIDKVLFGRIPAPSEVVPGLAPELDRVVMRGLDRDPTKRYETALQMSEELHRCVPPAPPDDVAALVRSIAGKEIDDAAARISRIERLEATALEPTAVAMPAAAAEPRARRNGQGAVEVAARSSAAQRASAHGRRGTARRWVVLVASVAAGLAALGIVSRARRAGRPVLVDDVTSPAVPAAVVPGPSSGAPPGPPTPRPDPSTSPVAGGAASRASPSASMAPSPPRISPAKSVRSAPRPSKRN
jgi:serine/threonine-protein kinase